MYNIYNMLTQAHTEKKRAAVTSLGHRRQRWQVGTPLSLSNKDLSLFNTTDPYQTQSPSHTQGGVMKLQSNCTTKWSMLHELDSA